MNRRNRNRIAGGAALVLGFVAAMQVAGQQPVGQQRIPAQTEPALATMAGRIVTALKPAKGERVILRIDPAQFPEVSAETKRRLEAAGAKVELLAYNATVPDFEAKLRETDIYIWMPTNLATPPAQAQALARWLDAGRGRQIHFHWGAGTVAADGQAGMHNARYDRMYLDALQIDYDALDKKMDETMAALRSGEVHVTSREGTDLRFRVGGRPFTKQNGDASRERMKSAKVRIDREIELPAGALRVAPMEESVEGIIAIPSARIQGTEVKEIRLAFQKGVLVQALASEGQAQLEAYLETNPALKQFREFALGMNPRLERIPGQEWIPYYGYGAGMVRLSLGDNEELGGKVRGGAVRWFFFTDTNVRAGEKMIVRSGRLL